jgi:asparagine synthase (glutamine-hydrolysing)
VAIDGFLTNREAVAAELGLAPEPSTEQTVAAGYRRWGTDLFNRLDGQWALILCDWHRGVALTARDHVGVGQLYYSSDANLVIVSADPTVVATARVGGPEVEPVRFGQFLNGFPPATQGLTFFAGVHAIPAGAALQITLDAGHRPSTALLRFWNPASPEHWRGNVTSFAESADQFDRLLVDAVRGRAGLHAIGALVSGGMDSSTVAAIAAEQVRSHQLQSVSILHDDPELTEEPHIRAVVSHAGLDAHYRTIRPADAWAAVDQVILAQGEPLLGQDLIGQWLAYRSAAELGIRALFDGFGADELLGGPGTEGLYLLDLARRARLVELHTEIGCLASRHRLPRSRIVRRYLLGTVRREVAWMLGRRRYRWIARPIPSDPARPALSADAPPTVSLLNRYLYRHVRHQNAATVLARLDRTAARLGVRPLVPFMDRRLVEGCLPLPDEYKIFRGQPKRLLHAVACRRLPRSVASRTDNMAIVSSSAWMPLRTEYADVIRAVPRQKRLRESGWVDGQVAERFVDSYLEGRHSDHLAVWRLFTAWRWLELFQLS